MPRRVTDYRGLTESSRLKLLHAVQRRPGQSLKSLAAAADIHVNTAREHLAVLEDEGLLYRAPVDTGRRGRPPMQYFPVDQPQDNQAAQDRATEASARGALLRRISPDRDHGQGLSAAALNQLDVLAEHLDDAGMDPVIDSQELTVGVRPCIYQDLLAEDRPLVCSVHAKLVRQQLEHVDGPLKLRRLHPFTTAHSCLLVLGADDEQTTTQESGIAADRTDTELAEFALAAQQRAAQTTDVADCPR
jgi:predicted ArsR family transcriptional regulator